ncbi:MAG: carboxypeptidase regulatory-like domain-containing protein [Terriglobales bacterium]
MTLRFVLRSQFSFSIYFLLTIALWLGVAWGQGNTPVPSTAPAPVGQSQAAASDSASAGASTSAPASSKASSKTSAGNGELRGHVRDSSGKLVANAAVVLEEASDTRTETWNAHTNSAGAFRFEGVHAGSYTVRVLEPENGVALAKSVELAAGEVKNVDLVLTAAQVEESGSTSAMGKSPELFDEPKFTVAGVAPAANAGGHGSDTVLRNSEALVRDTASLEAAGKADGNPAEGALLQEGAEIQAEILREENSGVVGADARTAGAGADVGATTGGAAAANAGNQKSRDDAGLDAATRRKRAELYHRLAQIDERLGNPLEAVHEYQRAAELAPSETNLFDWATELLTHRALEPATEVFEKGSARYPQSVRMLMGLGVAWYARGSYDRATEYLAKASDLAPGDAGPYLFMGKMLSVQTAVSPATMEKLERFVRVAPGNALAYYYYALGLWKQSAGALDDTEFVQIDKLLKKAVELDPKLGMGWVMLGVVYAQHGYGTAAIDDYKKAIEVSPELEEAHYRLGQAYKKAGDAAGAERELKIHDELAKQDAAQVESERAEIQEFVVKLRDK